jgi:3-deoxy-D-manno-octulosonate 8-phosphate phosphatase (KDO 8-P phosphatase)
MTGDKIGLLKSVRLLAMDVDGVLTDGTLGFDDQGREQKHFHVADGMGMTAIRIAGISVAWLSGRMSAAVTARAADLQISCVLQGMKNKGAALMQIAKNLALPLEAVAFVGDDWNDIAAFEVSGVRIAVANADTQVRQAADFVTVRTGGHGAIREVCDALLEAQGLTAQVLSRYLATLRETPNDAFPGQ